VEAFLDEWTGLLSQSPDRCREMEWAALRLCVRFAGLLAGMVLSSRRVAKAAEAEGMAARPDHVESPRWVKREVALPGDVRVTVRTPYCPPKARKARHSGGNEPGVYPACAALGIFEGMSPLAAELALRFSLQMPSFRSACDELGMLGHRYDAKTVRRVVGDFGKQALSARNRDMEAWRAGRLEPEASLRDRKVVAAVDGGRVRVRKKRKRSKRGKKRRFKTPWREPKLLIIYTLDEKGRRDPAFKVQIDGTLQGPDAVMELLAFHLYRLGAGEAQVVEFIADGAPWIWDRIDAVIRMAKLDRKQCRKVLDMYHAVEHLSAALEACGLSGVEKKKQLARLKRMLKEGKAEEVLLFLQGRLNRKGVDQAALREQSAYFQKRLPLLKYREIKRRRLVLGSGAVESAIRRVINLRIKSPSMFWDEDMAEVMIHLRAQLLGDRWDAMLDRIREHAKISRLRDYLFEPTPMSRTREAA
jgi:hypothetical protein